jgi:hypothetical protein
VPFHDPNFINEYDVRYTWKVPSDAPLKLHVRHTWSSDHPSRRYPALPETIKVVLDKTTQMTF